MSELGSMGDHRVPGDKSITHRALLLSALSTGTSVIRFPLMSEDTLATARVLGAMGVDIQGMVPGSQEVTVRGVGLRGLQSPQGVLDCGNSGTTARLLLGVLAGQPVTATLTGDASLRSRPMARVTGPLEQMGARVSWLETEGRLPLEIQGGEVTSMRYALPVASAQVKSALLLAGLCGGVPVELLEPGRSRDHTERMLRGLGVEVSGETAEGGWRVKLPSPPASLSAGEWTIPGDFSSAAFLLALGLLSGPEEGLRIKGVGLNPTRTSLLPVLESMGARLEVENGESKGEEGEPMGTLVASPSALKGVDVPQTEVPGFIDEIPILAALASQAAGTTRIRGAEELRVKESDRIRAMVDNLRAVGVEVTEHADGLDVTGGQGPPRGQVEVRHDHRIAMAFGVLGTVPGAWIRVDDPTVSEVSFPGFWELIRGVATRGLPPVVTLDGPAGAGKSSTAREVARILGFRHLDSGALYRGLTFVLLESGLPPAAWGGLGEAELDAFQIRLRPTSNGFAVMAGERTLPDASLRTPEVNAQVPALATRGAVRKWLLVRQREAGASGALVADGRDMGTVVFPQARVKVFLVADLEERARRRLLEQGTEPTAQRVIQEAKRLASRDRQDEGRKEAPLRKASDAHELDTTRVSFQEQVDAIVAWVKPWLPPDWQASPG